MNLFEQHRFVPPHVGVNYIGNTSINYSPQLAAPFAQLIAIGSNMPSPTFSDANEGGNSKRKRRLEIKNKSETKRRNKFNDQLNTLKTLLECDETEDAKVLTRDQVMSKAIQEIQRLKNLLHGQNDKSGQSETNTTSISSDSQVIVTLNGFTKKSLNDPFNRYPWTKDDLDTTFHVLYTKEFIRIFHINRSRTADALMGCVKSLYDIADQIGKPEYKLYVSIMEQVFHSTIATNPKELKRILDRNLALYNQVKTERNVSEIVLARGEVSVLLFSDFAWYHQLVGNVEESDRIWKFAFKLSQQIVNYTTRNFLLIGIPMLNHFRGNITTTTEALKYKELMKYDASCKEIHKLLMAQALARNGQYEEAIKHAEDGIVQLLDCWGEAADALMAAILIDILLKAGRLDRGLSVVNATLKKCDELNIEGFASKAELLRLKAKLLFAKIKQQIEHKIEGSKLPAKAPQVDNVLPQEDSSLFHVDNIAIHLNFSDLQAFDGTTSLSNSNNQPETQIVSKPGPADLAQVELLLQQAMHLAKQKELSIVELRCTVDIAEVWLAFGDDMQKLEALHGLETVCEQMKEAQGAEDYATAQKLIVELKAHVVCLFPNTFL